MRVVACGVGLICTVAYTDDTSFVTGLRSDWYIDINRLLFHHRSQFVLSFRFCVLAKKLQTSVQQQTSP